MNLNQSTAERNRPVAVGLSNNFARLLREFSRDFERRIFMALAGRGYADLRPAHSSVFANLGLGAVRVTELAERAQVTQQAMGKMLKEVERLGYIARDVDRGDKRAKEIRLTERGMQLTIDCLEVVDELMAYYEERIGHRDFVSLQIQMRDAVGKLELNYLPESWTDHELQ